MCGGGAAWTTGALFTTAFGFTGAVVRGGVVATGGAACGGTVLDATAVGVGGASGEALAVGVVPLASELLAADGEPPLPQPAMPSATASRNAAPPAFANALDKFFTGIPSLTLPYFRINEVISAIFI